MAPYTWACFVMFSSMHVVRMSMCECVGGGVHCTFISVVCAPVYLWVFQLVFLLLCVCVSACMCGRVCLTVSCVCVCVGVFQCFSVVCVCLCVCLCVSV